MFKVNNKDTRTTPGVVLVSLLLTLNIFHTLFSVSIVDFEQVNADWDDVLKVLNQSPFRILLSIAFEIVKSQREEKTL